MIVLVIFYITYKGGNSMRKKSVIGLFLVAGMLLSACGGSQSGEVPEGTESMPLEDSASQADKGLSDGTVTLTVSGAEEDQELLAQIVESFKQEYAGQADFEISIIAIGEADCKNTMLADVNNSPDVFAFADDQLMSMAAAGVLAPVPNADEIKEQNTEGAVTASSVGDTLYAYPMTADNGYFMYYNKEYFTEEDVTNLDTMLAIAAENGKKITMDWSSGWYLYSFFGCTDMQVGLNDDGISNYCTWNSSEGEIKGIDVANALLAISASPGFMSAGDDGLLAGAADGSVIAGVSGVWNATAMEAAWGSNYGAVKLPTYTCAGQQVQMSSFTGYKMVGANAYSKNVDWALKLAEWITNEQNQTLRFTMRGQGPSNINAASSADVQASPAIKAVLAQSEYGNLQRIGGKYWEPVSTFGVKMANGNPNGEDLQKLLDETVEAVTVAY